MSPQTIQKIMPRAKADLEAAMDGELDWSLYYELANIGTSGAHSCNCSRDLKNLMNRPKLSAARHTFQVPMKSPTNRFHIAPQWQDVLLPHEIFHLMFHHYPAVFLNKFCGAAGAIQAWWSDMRGHPCLDGHPMKEDPDWERWTIPISIHGDATPVAGCGKAWAKLLDIYSWSSMLVVGNTRDVMIYMYAALVNLMTQEGWTRVWKVMAWSLNALRTGKWPDKDPWGQPFPSGSEAAKRAGQWLAGRYRAIIWCLKGDLDYFAKCLKLAHYGSAHPCCLCPCNNTEGDGMCWSEFRPSHAEWMGELWTNDEWRAMHTAVHLLFTIPGVGITMVYMDYMHVKYLGTDKYVYASILLLLVHDLMMGDAAANLAAVWDDCRAFYREKHMNGHFTHMTLNMFCTPANPGAKFPRMRGKAHEIKLLGGAFASSVDREDGSWQRHASTGSVAFEIFGPNGGDDRGEQRSQSLP